MPRLQKKIDVMVGSERMLKAHHKNFVFSKSLLNKKMTYDARCTRNLGKMQQDIYEVYFNEYLPLKADADKIKQRLPKLQDSSSALLQPKPIPGRGRKLVLPDISSQTSLMREGTCIVKDTHAYLNTLREKAAARKRRERQQWNTKHSDWKPREYSDLRNDGHMQSRCSGWPDSMSEGSSTPPINEKRLQILKTAIALTSQPVKPPEPRKPKRLRRSFLVQLRRQSKVVWETEVLQRVFRERCNLSEASDTPAEPPADMLKWRPSLFNNKICNSDEDEDKNDTEFHLDREPRDSVVSGKSDASKLSLKKDVPVHDIEEDLYHPESSPDIFSVISEHTGSYYSDSSFTSGSDYSYSSSQTDGEYM